MVSNAISFGRSARQDNTNPRPVGRRADEFDAGGFECGFDVEERRRATRGHTVNHLEALDRLNTDTRLISQFLDRPS